MYVNKISDDIHQLIEVLPKRIQDNLLKAGKKEELLEVIMDLGRLPEVRYTNNTITLEEKLITNEDIESTINKIGDFGKDNRAGIEKTLHRISAIRNRKGQVVGLTCRIGRAIFGSVEIIKDLIKSGQSILLMGHPGVGKTTALREIARVMANEMNRRVVIIDTSNEIAGDGDIPHHAIGRARRMQVRSPEDQHQVMIEAVENHMPEVIIIDEIGTELETLAARTIAERGVQLIATAHGRSISNLIKNPTLRDLIGGVKSVTLGDDEAKKRSSQKTILERASEPTFSIAVEINSRNSWKIYKDIAKSVDILLSGDKPVVENREIRKDGEQIIKKCVKNITSGDRPLPRKISTADSHPIPNQRIPKVRPLNVICIGIAYQSIEETVEFNHLEIVLVQTLETADVILTVRNGLRGKQILRREAKKLKLPIHVIKSDDRFQIERALKRLIKIREVQE